MQQLVKRNVTPNGSSSNRCRLSYSCIVPSRVESSIRVSHCIHLALDFRITFCHGCSLSMYAEACENTSASGSTNCGPKESSRPYTPSQSCDGSWLDGRINPAWFRVASVNTAWLGNGERLGGRKVTVCRDNGGGCRGVQYMKGCRNQAMIGTNGDR